MKHRSPSHSLQPARVQARQQAREVARVAARLPGAAAPVETGQWRVIKRDDGALVARHEPTGTDTVMATPPPDPTTTTETTSS